MLRTLANLDPQPESVPINALVAVAGTPLESLPPVDPLDLVRMIAVARILMPKARVRLSAGRTNLSREAQMMCLFAGANSIFYGEKLLTTPNPDEEADLSLIRDAGLRAMPPAASAAGSRPGKSKAPGLLARAGGGARRGRCGRCARRGRLGSSMCAP